MMVALLLFFFFFFFNLPFVFVCAYVCLCGFVCASKLMMCEGTSARVHVSVAARRWLWLQFLGCHPLGFYSLGQGLTT